ncbi:9067_t:CDS:1, partial [Racocetra persica]
TNHNSWLESVAQELHKNTKTILNIYRNQEDISIIRSGTFGNAKQATKNRNLIH